MKKYILMTFVGLGVATFYQPQASAATEYSIKEMTPEVSTALENRRVRFDKIRELKSKGAIGENSRGYVEALDPSAQSLVDDENKDRKVIYETIAEQNNLKDALDVIEKVFGQVQRDKATAGDKVQDEQGNWVTK